MILGKNAVSRDPLAKQTTRTLSAYLTNERYGRAREQALNRKFRKQGYLSLADRRELNQIRVSLGGAGYHRLGPSVFE